MMAKRQNCVDGTNQSHDSMIKIDGACIDWTIMTCDDDGDNHNIYEFF